MGPEAAKEFKESSVIEKGGGVVISFPGKMEKEVEPVKKETSKEHKERMGRNKRRIAWILLGTLPPITTETVLETIHDTGHAEIIPWYDSFRDKVVNGVKSFFVKTPGGEVIGTINATPETTVATTAPETTPQETVPPTATTEQAVIAPESKGIIEDEGMKLPAFEGLRYDVENNTYFAEAGNPYGLEAGEKAGVFYKNILDINNVIWNWTGKEWNREEEKIIEGVLALKTEIISPWQKEILEEKHSLKCALPFFSNGQVIKIRNDIRPTGRDNIWYEPSSQWACFLPKGSKIYSPIESFFNNEPFFNGCIYQNLLNREDFFSIEINALPNVIEKVIFQGEKPDLCAFNMSVYDAKLIKNGEKISEQPQVFYKINEDIYVGTPLVEIVRDADPNDPDRKEWNLDQSTLIFHLAFLKGNLQSGDYKIARTVENVLMEAKDIQGNASQGIKISILPVHD